MPKRENENSQMRREDYEALNARRGGGDDDGTFTQGFEKATPEVAKKRRMLRVRRPASQSKVAAAAATPAAATPASSSNPFASVSLTGGAPAPGAFSFTAGSSSQNPAPSTGVSFSFGSGSTPAPAPSKGVSFSFGGSTPATTSATTPAASIGFPFSGTPAPAAIMASTAGATPAPFGFGKKSSTPISGQEKLVKRYQDQACAFIDSFGKQCKEINPQTTYMLPIVDHVLDALYVVEDQYWKHCKKEEDDKSPATASKDAIKSTAGATPAPFGFGAKSSSSSPSTTAASPAPNLFGNPAPAPSAPKGFGFGSTNVPNTGMTPGSSFSFAGGTAFGGGTPAPAPSSGANEAGDAPADEIIKAASGDADKDYKLLETIPMLHVTTKGKDGKFEKKFSGELKIQEHKENQKRRMIMRDQAVGKVMLNLALPEWMAFQSTPFKKMPSTLTQAAIFPGQITVEQEAGLIRLVRRGPQTLKSLEDVFTGLGVAKKG